MGRYTLPDLPYDYAALDSGRSSTVVVTVQAGQVPR